MLHNVQTVIDQNLSISREKKYALPDFYRFPFHLFKKESWDVEHIRPNNAEDFQGERKENERKKYIYVLKESAKSDERIQTAIGVYVNSAKDADAFGTLWEIVNNGDENGELTDDQKNKIWNYVLLDSSTNREYGNACFAIKRDYVLSKERGIKPKIFVNDNGDVEQKEIAEAAFVPICTRKVFSKEYSKYPDNLRYWTEKDAAYYRMDIEKTLWWYLNENSMSKDDFDSKYKEYSNHILSTEDYGISFAAYLGGARHEVAGGTDNE